MSLSDTLREAFLPERSAHADRLPRRLLREISRMPRLTGILPYVAWQEETRLFALDQGAFGERESQAIGFCIEALPQTGANDEMEKVLASLFVSCPPGTGIQVTLYGSPNILPVLQAQANLLPRSARMSDRLPTAALTRMVVGKIAVTTTSSGCSRGGASITTCTVPASQFLRIRPICCAIFGR
jgi:hypothetical protein